jgi:hypothetical protein
MHSFTSILVFRPRAEIKNVGDALGNAEREPNYDTQVSLLQVIRTVESSQVLRAIVTTRYNTVDAKFRSRGVFCQRDESGVIPDVSPPPVRISTNLEGVRRVHRYVTAQQGECLINVTQLDSHDGLIARKFLRGIDLPVAPSRNEDLSRTVEQCGLPRAFSGRLRFPADYSAHEHSSQV